MKNRKGEENIKHIFRRISIEKMSNERLKLATILHPFVDACKLLRLL